MQSKLSRPSRALPLLTLAVVAIAWLAPMVLAGNASAGCNAGEYGEMCLPCPGGSATPCNNNGTCDEGTAGSGNCSCFAGYTGVACQYSGATTCSGNGTVNYDGTCNCNAGYGGVSCDQCGPDFYNYPTCTFCTAAATCNGNGTCNLSGSCNCNAGFGGASCDQCAPGYFNYPTCATTTTTTTTTLVAAACPALPSEDCLEAAASVLTIKDNADDGKDTVSWKWSKGVAFNQVILDDPAVAAYRLCIYDSSSSVSALATSLEVAPGALWTDLDPKGWKYQDAAGSSDGVTLVQLKPGADTKTRIQLKARGVDVPLPSPISATEFFDMDPDVTVQLFNDTNGTCWGAELVTVKKNLATAFQAKKP